jgi:hypothetical protein
MTAGEVAALLGVDPTWVYENADDLGVIRIGKGKRPRLRFDRAVIAERLTPRPRSRFARKPSPPPAPGVSLLPIKPRPRHNHREE